MAHRDPTYYLAIPKTELKKASVTVVMDMLRYDNALVQGERFGCYVLTTTHPHAVGRWRSFGIVPVNDGYSALDTWDLDKEIKASPLVTLQS